MNAKIQISVCQSKTSLFYPRTYTLQEFLYTLKHPVITKETVEQYHSYPVDRQARIKDVGGFFGGRLLDNRRDRAQVKDRSLLCFDIDNGDSDFIDQCKKKIGKIFYFIHTTHKHTPEKPRYRLLIPLSDYLQPEFYTPLCRYIASVIGGKYFTDTTTFQNSRLMYWPSVSKDGEYICVYNKAPLLNGMQLWQKIGADVDDVRTWKLMPHEKALHKPLAEAENPLTKDNIIGTFCRAYTISQAIEKFLSKIYTPSDIENRYTYTKGTTTGGLVVYNDVFAYSHHSTDPVSEKLVNAFDLVRIHLFGSQDKEAKAGTPVTELKSYLTMVNRIKKLPAIQQQVKKDKADKDAKEAALVDVKENEKYFKELLKYFDVDEEEKTDTGSGFDETTDKEEQEEQEEDKVSFDEFNLSDSSEAWADQLEVVVSGKQAGEVKETAHNYEIIFKNDPLLKDNLRFNLFSGNDEVRGPLFNDAENFRPVEEIDFDLFLIYMDKEFGFGIRPTAARYAWNVAFRNNRYHPIKDYLEDCYSKWDGVKRLDTFFIDHLGCEDNSYNRAVCRKTLLAAVKRIYKPGCKFDTFPIFQGPEGIGKSVIIARLGGPWASESLGDITTKEAAENIRSKWIIEIPELSDLSRFEDKKTKAFVSKQQDTYRAAFGRKAQTIPRTCIFIGNTNEDDFIRSLTGNRRMWPVECGIKTVVKHPYTLTQDEIAQLWGETVALYKTGKESLLLNREQTETLHELHERYLDEPVEVMDKIVQWLFQPLPLRWYKMSADERRNWTPADLTNKERTAVRSFFTYVELYNECFKTDSIRIANDVKMQIRRAVKIITRRYKFHKQKSPKRIPGYGLSKYYLSENKIQTTKEKVKELVTP